MEKKEVVDNEETRYLSFTLNLFKFCYISIFWYEKYRRKLYFDAFETNVEIFKLLFVNFVATAQGSVKSLSSFQLARNFQVFSAYWLENSTNTTIKRFMCTHASTIYVIRYKANELWVIRCNPSATILWSLHVYGLYGAIFNARI